jgi:hypothetical protein
MIGGGDDRHRVVVRDLALACDLRVAKGAARFRNTVFLAPIGGDTSCEDLRMADGALRFGNAVLLAPVCGALAGQLRVAGKARGLRHVVFHAPVFAHGRFTAEQCGELRSLPARVVAPEPHGEQ